MSFFRKKYVWAVLYSLALTGLTAYTVLDTFVIKRVYTQVETEVSAAEASEISELAADTAETEKKHSPASGSKHSSKRDEKNSRTDEDTPQAPEEPIPDNMPMTSAVISENSYSDKNFTVTVTQYRTNDTDVYVGDVVLSSSEFLKTAFAENSYGKNITAKTSETAEKNHALLAINGDYYGAREKGYVLRNGILYRSTAAEDQEDLVIYDDGSFEIINEEETAAAELSEAGAWQILSFGPALVEDGEIAVTAGEEVGKAKASNPRTAIGIIDDLHYVFVVADGRTDESEGLSLYELAEFMRQLGTETAYNLDGGGSSVMYFNGAVINKPTTNGKTIKERSVSDIVYIGY